MITEQSTCMHSPPLMARYAVSLQWLGTGPFVGAPHAADRAAGRLVDHGSACPTSKAKTSPMSVKWEAVMEDAFRVQCAPVQRSA